MKGNGLGGVKVTCGKKETTTLFDGTYEFNNLNSATYTITAYMKGFQTKSDKVEVQKNSTVTLNLYLSEAVGTSKIYGYVYDNETKKPITSGGTVILVLPAANRYAYVDGNGRFEFSNLAADTYEVGTSILGYGDEKATVTVAHNEMKNLNFYCKFRRIEEPPWG